jgi:outer membrane receptor protein involved in Fe transport
MMPGYGQNLFSVKHRNKMKKKLLAVLMAVSVSMLFVTRSYSENYVPDPKGGTISGRVLDASTNKPMEYVNIAVFRSADSSLITGTITNPDGQFKLEKIASGEYYLRLTFLGFENQFIKKINVNTKSLQVDLGDIKLATAAAEISGVSVVADRAKVEYQIDKRVINVSQDLVAKGGTAVNVLENTPSIQVDPQGNVTLRGSSDYIVLIDGKPSVLKGSDALKTINAAAIKQIEVITNPSARYEADGKAGIINIIQKKEKMQGVSGTASVSIGTTDKNSANGLINYRKNKVNVFAGIDFAQNKYLSNLTIDNVSFLEEGNQHISERVQQYNHNDNLGGKLGIDYELNQKNSLSISGNYGIQGYDQGAHATYNYHFEGAEQKNYFKSNSDLDVTGNVPGLNFDYTHKFGENHSLSVSSTYSSWDGVDENLVSEFATDNNYNELTTQSSLKYTKDNFNYQYRLNLDYKRPVKKATLEVGFQYRYENRKDDLVFKNLDIESNEWIVNTLYTGKLDYKNDIYSGYATFSDTKWGIGYMIGVRSEYFTRSINFSSDGDTYNYDKFMLYPSVHLSKSIKDKHQFQLSYSRRINRPQPWLLNKTPGYIDPYNIFKGSPELEPEFTDAFELNYRVTYKITTLSVQTYYRNTTNSFDTKRTLGNDGIMVHELINANRQQSYGAEFGLDFKITKWWQLSTGANLYHYSIETTSSSASTRSDNTFDARIISNFSLKWGSRIQAVGYARGPALDAQGKSDGFYTVNLAVSQPLMKGKVNVGLSAQNIFNSIKFDYKASSINYNNTYAIAVEGLVLQLTASYSFNNFQNKQRGRADDASFKGGGAF